LALSLVVLTIAAPAMLLIAIAIRLDSPGPALYRQQRFGFNGNRFAVLKFRTMVASAGDQAPAQARRGDPRVTRVGGLLRRTSLDELPQLLNVLRGDMSLVGPRPHAVSHNEYYAGLIDGYLARHRVKPGITGWAQVNGLRGETDTLEKMERRVEHDLHYIDNWSLLLDLEILVRTIFVGFVHRNAY
jgi:exopolysaccharide biosynthesis polyprenyl glycosylphosphotransferase